MKTKGVAKGLIIRQGLGRNLRVNVEVANGNISLRFLWIYRGQVKTADFQEFITKKEIAEAKRRAA